MSMNTYGAHDYGMLIPKRLAMEIFKSIAQEDFDMPDITDEELENDVKEHLYEYLDAMTDYGFAQAMYNFEGSATSISGLFPDGTDYEDFPSRSPDFDYSSHLYYIPMDRQMSPFKAAYKDVSEMVDEIYDKLVDNYDVKGFTKDDVKPYLVYINGAVTG